MSVTPIFKRLKQEDCHKFEVITVKNSTPDKHRFKRRLYFWKKSKYKTTKPKTKNPNQSQTPTRKEDGLSMKSLVLLWLDGWQTGFYQNSLGRDQIGWELDFYVFCLQLEVLNGCVRCMFLKMAAFFSVFGGEKTMKMNVKCHHLQMLSRTRALYHLCNRLSLD